MFVLNSWVSWVDFCWVVVLIRVRVAVVGGSDLGLLRGLLCGLVLLSPSIFCWRNSSPAPPLSSQPVLRFDFSVCSVNRVHQSHRRSGFVSSIWVLGLFVDADLSFCHRVSMSIWVLPLGFSRIVFFAKNCERPPEFAGFQSCWVFTNIDFFFFWSII